MTPVTKTLDAEKLIDYLKTTHILDAEDTSDDTPTAEQCYQQLRQWIAQLENNIGSFLAVIQGFDHPGLRAALRRATIAQEYDVDPDFVSDDRPYISHADDDHLILHTPQGDITLAVWGTPLKS